MSEVTKGQIQVKKELLDYVRSKKHKLEIEVRDLQAEEKELTDTIARLEKVILV